MVEKSIAGLGVGEIGGYHGAQPRNDGGEEDVD
jgi:hypothetical protein